MTNGKTDQPTSEERESALESVNDWMRTWFEPWKRGCTYNGAKLRKSAVGDMATGTIIAHLATIRAALSQPTVNDNFTLVENGKLKHIEKLADKWLEHVEAEPVNDEFPVTICEVECENLEDMKAVFAGFYTGECRHELEQKPNSSVCDLVKTTVNGVIDHLHSQGLICRNPQWQPMETMPRGEYILILPKMGMPFVGDIWDCKNRTDIEVVELARHRTAGGSITTYETKEIEAWAHYPKLPNPPQENNDA